MSTTARHKLKLRNGHFLVDVTEAPDAIHFGFRGARPRDDEDDALATFLLPLVDQYRDDPRRMEFTGTHSAHVGIVRPLGGDWWLAYEQPIGAEGVQ